MFELREVSFEIKGSTLIQNINCCADEGDFVAIIGPNGAGKSTLLKCLGGLIQPTQGDVTYNNKSIKKAPAKSIAVTRAYLNQQLSTAFDYPIREIIMMGRFPHIVTRPSREDHDVVDQLIEMLHLKPFQDRMLKTLSGGELQRVHFARTLAQLWTNHNQLPKLLLLDEPANNLDPHYQHSLLKAAKDFSKAQNTTVVAVLHDLNLATSYADQIWTMNRGKIVAQGHPTEVLTAELIQDLYQIPASIHQENGHMHISIGPSAHSIFQPEKTLQYERSPL